MKELIEATAIAFGVTPEELLSPTRTDELAQARFAAMLVMRRRGYSFPRIALTLNRSDHTTVIHGVGRGLHLERTNPSYAKSVAFIEEHSADEHAAAMIVAESPLTNVRGRKAWGPSNPVEALRAYEDGASILEIATSEGVATQTVRNWLKRQGVTIRRGRGKKRKPDQRIPEIMAMRKEGATLQEIGDHFGITRERVRQLVIKAGLSKEFEDRPPTPFETAAFEEYKSGASLDWLAQELGVAASTARSRLIKNGYKVRPSRKKLKAKAERERLAAQIAERYQSGEKTPSIAKAFGFKKPEQIYRYLAIAGVRPRRATDGVKVFR